MNATPRVYVDAQILIYTGELDPRFWSSLRNFWNDVDARRVSVLTSELSVLECTVYPLRQNDSTLIKSFDALFTRANLQLLPVDLQTLRSAANLRATMTSLKTPDAIHAATAILSQADYFLTNDAGLRKVQGLNVKYLNDGKPTFS